MWNDKTRKKKKQTTTTFVKLFSMRTQSANRRNLIWLAKIRRISWEKKALTRVSAPKLKRQNQPNRWMHERAKFMLVNFNTRWISSFETSKHVWSGKNWNKWMIIIITTKSWNETIGWSAFPQFLPRICCAVSKVFTPPNNKVSAFKWEEFTNEDRNRCIWDYRFRRRRCHYRQVVAFR